MRKGESRGSKAPYGAPLFFSREKDKPLRGFFSLPMSKSNHEKEKAQLSRSDEMFNFLGEVKLFSKMDLKTGFH